MDELNSVALIKLIMRGEDEWQYDSVTDVMPDRGMYRNVRESGMNGRTIHNENRPE